MTTPVALQTQLARRSSSNLTEPGPTDEQLGLILQAATTVPDHGNLRPWRFVVVRNEARSAFGDALAGAGAEALGNDPRTDKLRGKAFVAPALVVIIAVPRTSPKVPASEQRDSAACTGYAMTLAAYSLGLGAVWKTAPYLSGTALTALFELQPGEEILGWVNLGNRSREGEPEFPRAQLTEIAAEVDATGVLRPFAG
jgi:nitroreductase